MIVRWLLALCFACGAPVVSFEPRTQRTAAAPTPSEATAAKPTPFGLPDTCPTRCTGDLSTSNPPTFFPDADGDGAGGPTQWSPCEPSAGWVEFSGDCDDWDPRRAPDQIEVCDAADNDCDGLIDEDLPGCGVVALGPTPTFERCSERFSDGEKLPFSKTPWNSHAWPWPAAAYAPFELALSPLMGFGDTKKTANFEYPNASYRDAWTRWLAAAEDQLFLGWAGLWHPPGHRVPECIYDEDELLPWAYSTDPELLRCPLPHLAYAVRPGWFEVRLLKPEPDPVRSRAVSCPGPKPPGPPPAAEAAVRVEKLFAHWRVPRCDRLADAPVADPLRVLVGARTLANEEVIGRIRPEVWTPEEQLALLHQLAWEAHPHRGDERALRWVTAPNVHAVMARLDPVPLVRTCTYIEGRFPRCQPDEQGEQRFFEVDWSIDADSGEIRYTSTPVRPTSPPMEPPFRWVPPRRRQFEGGREVFYPPERTDAIPRHCKPTLTDR